MVDPDRRAVRVDRQLVRIGRETERRGIERRVRMDHLRIVEGLVIGHDVARIRCLVAKAAGRVDGAQHTHQDCQRALHIAAEGPVKSGSGPRPL